MRNFIKQTCFLVFMALQTSSLSFSSSEKIELTPAAVRNSVKQHGSKAVLLQIYGNTEEWDALLRNLSTGSSEWLGIYSLLKPVSDAGSAEMLDIAISKALISQPETVLSFMSNESHAEVRLVCGRLDDDAAPVTFVPFLRKQRAAVLSITSKKLKSIKGRCLDAVDAAIKYQQSRR